MRPEMSNTTTRGDWVDSQTGPDEVPPIQPLTAEEAARLRSKHPPVSPWRVVGIQAIAGVICALVAWAVAARNAAAGSALYGAASVVLPSALMAYGVTRRTSPDTSAMALRFMVWEAVKVLMAVAMLVLAPWVVPELSWPALLAGLIVCLKVNWLAFAWRRRK